MNQVASESAFTATANGAVGCSAPAENSRARSRVSRSTCRAYRATLSPASVAMTGLVRWTSTRPAASSMALIRWDTADGVMWSASAALSNVPSASTVISVAS